MVEGEAQEPDRERWTEKTTYRGEAFKAESYSQATV
jgi:hypothetical protein